MSDERDLTPEQEARVARLLADARVREPIPTEVAARLDRVLAGLSAEPVAGPDHTPATVVDLAARRRRRVRTLLVAAAAVVVAGVGVGQVISSDEGGGADTASEAGDGGGAALEREPSISGPEAGAAEDVSPEELEALGEPARMTTRSFTEQVRRLQDRPGVRSDAGAMLSDRDMTSPKAGFSCGLAGYGPGKLMAVRYNGTPAVLAYRPPVGDTQVVDLLQCGSGALVRSTTVPLP